VGQSKRVIHNFNRPTLVAIVTKIGKFEQKNDYNSACIWDITKILAPNRGFWGRPL